MLEVGPLILAGGQKSGKICRRAPGKAMLAYLWALVAFMAFMAKAEVEFKHHNNTEMAAVLQQVHNRWVILRKFVSKMYLVCEKLIRN